MNDVKRASLEVELLAAMQRAASHRMQWGRDDCALWCADILKAALGYDGAAPFRGRYKTRIGAHRVLGHGGLPRALRQASRRHGWRRVRSDRADVGDVGVASLGGVISTVICRKPGWFVGRSDEGWTALPASMVKVAWCIIA
ncbi:hypothetical protein IVA94_14900 [Bradyrhizobium sp. 156]|uniref:DUF6950 family protein n=1 Tax=Bradyrhizobium sp. 156 TaxID=2782630 RepID=UPI001FFBE37B|nr:hypothetical protein [Bradyrhizobium sp. 156]